MLCHSSPWCQSERGAWGGDGLQYRMGVHHDYLGVPTPTQDAPRHAEAVSPRATGFPERLTRANLFDLRPADGAAVSHDA